MDGIFKLSVENVKSAVISGLLMAGIGVSGYITSLGDVFSIDPKALVNVAVMAFLTSVVSIVKSLLTTKSGDFVGAVKVAPPEKK